MAEMIIGTNLTKDQAQAVVVEYRAPHLSRHAQVVDHIDSDGEECVGVRVMGSEDDVVMALHAIYRAEGGTDV